MRSLLLDVTNLEEANKNVPPSHTFFTFILNFVRSKFLNFVLCPGTLYIWERRRCLRISSIEYYKEYFLLRASNSQSVTLFPWTWRHPNTNTYRQVPVSLYLHIILNIHSGIHRQTYFHTNHPFHTKCTGGRTDKDPKTIHIYYDCHYHYNHSTVTIAITTTTTMTTTTTCCSTSKYVRVLCICPSSQQEPAIHPSIRLSVRLSVHSFVRPSVCLSSACRLYVAAATLVVLVDCTSVTYTSELTFRTSSSIAVVPV